MQQVVAVTAGMRAAWGRGMPLLQALLAAERGRFILWLPVFMGAGVLLYFAQHAEPPAWAGAAVAVPALAACILAGGAPLLRLLLAPLAAAAIGFASAQYATARALPITPLPTHAVILTGIVHRVELLPEGRRVTFSAPRLGDAGPLARELRVRLRNEDPAVLRAGDTVRIRAMVRPPAPPAYPGAWDLQRDAFFAGLGGGGWALGHAEVLAQAEPRGVWRWIDGLRDAIDRRIAADLPAPVWGPVGAICATLLTGVTSAIPPPDRAAFRDSGLAHLLAVAGLHIGIVMGLFLGLTRNLLALTERTALHWPCKQIAAVTALASGFAYMLLTGMHVPIMRSFAMACLLTLGVVAGRRSISLRGLALAAVALMLIEPDQVAGVSFQMSFSAVLALIVGYEWLRPHLTRLRRAHSWWGRTRLHLAALALTSALAGTASAPFGAFHFGQIQLYFVISNMVAVPITAMLVMPAGLAALALMPLGLERLALLPMGWGVQAILWIARTTASLPAAILSVPHMPAWGLAVLSLGMAWLGLWRSRMRLAGIALIAAGLASPILADPPDLLVSADARLIGWRAPSGTLWLQSKSGAAKFTLEAWQQVLASAAVQPFADQGEDEAGAMACTPQACRLRPRADGPAALLLRAPGPADCAGAAIIIAADPVRDRCGAAEPGALRAVVDRFSVWRDGSQAVWLRPDGVRVLSDRGDRGSRPWVPPPPKPRAQSLDGLRMAEPEPLPPE